MSCPLTQGDVWKAFKEKAVFRKSAWKKKR